MPADFGLKLLARGVSLGSKVHFTSVLIPEISIIGKAAFMSTVDHSYQRISYLARLRYHPDILQLLLIKAEPGTRDALFREFTSAPFTLRSITVAPPVKTGIIARLQRPPDDGPERAAYAPLEIVSLE